MSVRRFDHDSRAAIGMFRVAAVVVALHVVCSTDLSAADPAPPVPVDLQPYRVRIELAFSLRSDIDGAFRRRVVSELEDGLDRSLGNLWDCTIASDRCNRPAGRNALERIRPSEVPALYETDGLDKLYLLSIEDTGSGYRLIGREWDSLTAQLAASSEIVFPERREVASRALSLLREMFRPVAVVTPQKNGPVLLRPKGASLAPHDDGWLPVSEGALFETYYRYLNKELVLERIQQVPWTYLTAGPLEAGASVATVTSGLRGAVSVRRRRIEIVGLMVRHREPSTRLTLTTFAPRRRPLGGIEVEVVPLPPPKSEKPKGEIEAGGAKEVESKPDQPPAPEVRLVTDRNGRVVIQSSADGSNKPMLLLVRSGQNLLARVPFVAGVRREETLELPDDTLRLEVEGEVAQLQSELVDTVARRAVLSALARSRAKARDWEAADTYLKQVSIVPKSSTFMTSLNAIRINGLEASRAQKDKATELRVKRLCDETAALIKDYLEDDKLAELREEIAELKQIAVEDEAAEKEFASGKKKAASVQGKSTTKPPRGKDQPNEPVQGAETAAGAGSEAVSQKPASRENEESREEKPAPGKKADPPAKPKPKGPAF